MFARLPKAWLAIVFMSCASLAMASPESMKTSTSASDSSDGTKTADRSAPMASAAIIMLDYQIIPIKGYESIDLVGFHAFKKVNDWLYAGVGGEAPLAKGNYGGFMVFDISAFAQKKLFGNLSANIGGSLGGGGGGNSVQQSKVISGGGGFRKGFVGLGYDFDRFTAGVDVSNIRFTGSAIHRSQVDFFIQTPFSYSVSPYASSDESLLSGGSADRSMAPTKAGDNRIDIGFDNIIQIKPKGSYKKAINLADLQFSHFVTDHSYLLIEGGVGYRGLPIYNQVLGGAGYQYSVSQRLSARAQLALGSGGYAPEKIDTGSGLLVYPKVSLEYLLSKDLGVSLTGGYLYAPNGSSRNATIGAALDYHSSPVDWSGNTAGVRYGGHRFNLFEQSEFKVKHNGRTQSSLDLLSIQFDNVVSRNFYVPVQASVAYNGYFGYPGYGELATGLGVQTEYSPHDKLQTFAQIIAGANVKGVIVKPAAGLNYGLNDQLAIYGQVGTTFSRNSSSGHSGQQIVSSPTVGLGFTYRFSLASR